MGAMVRKPEGARFIIKRGRNITSPIVRRRELESRSRIGLARLGDAFGKRETVENRGKLVVSSIERGERSLISIACNGLD